MVNLKKEVGTNGKATEAHQRIIDALRHTGATNSYTHMPACYCDVDRRIISFCLLCSITVPERIRLGHLYCCDRRPVHICSVEVR